MNEFLKLCNLFSQDLIDKSVLVGRVSNFIGGNPELMTWFKRFVGYDSRDEVIENRPRAPTTRVSLSNCRGYGPSYRFLPIRVSLEPFHFTLFVFCPRCVNCGGRPPLSWLLCVFFLSTLKSDCCSLNAALYAMSGDVLLDILAENSHFILLSSGPILLMTTSTFPGP